MHERYITFNGVTTKSLGLIYSTFTETVPEPRTIYVDVPGSYPVDVSTALGDISYGNGIHVLTFLLYADTQEERLAKKAGTMALFHGKRANYTLSWADGTYNGRAVVAFEHRWDNVDVVTVTITHSPFWNITSSYYLYPTPTNKSASYASIEESIQGGMEYEASVRLYQSGSAQLGSNSRVFIENTTASLGKVSNTGASGTPLSIYISDWWIGKLSNGNIILHASHFPNPVDNEVTTDSDWALSGTNLACSNYGNMQRAYVTLTKRGF